MMLKVGWGLGLNQMLKVGWIRKSDIKSGWWLNQMLNVGWLNQIKSGVHAKSHYGVPDRMFKSFG